MRLMNVGRFPLGNSRSTCLQLKVTVSEIFHFYENPKIGTFSCGTRFLEERTRIIF